MLIICNAWRICNKDDCNHRKPHYADSTNCDDEFYNCDECCDIGGTINVLCIKVPRGYPKIPKIKINHPWNKKNIKDLDVIYKAEIGAIKPLKGRDREMAIKSLKAKHDKIIESIKADKKFYYR